MSDFKIEESLLQKIVPVPYTNKKGITDYVVQLPNGKYLHWIESLDNSPVTCSRPDICMQRWNFPEQAQAICEYLKQLWSVNQKPDFNKHATIEFEVEIKVS